jgi:hypothetical protein
MEVKFIDMFINEGPRKRIDIVLKNLTLIYQCVGSSGPAYLYLQVDLLRLFFLLHVV